MNLMTDMNYLELRDLARQCGGTESLSLAGVALSAVWVAVIKTSVLL